jgi:hypothetical protein
MVARTGKKLSSYSGSTGLQEGNNLMYNGSTFGFFNNTDIMADPQFANVATNDFRLSPTSPGIDAGNGTTNLYDPTDITGISRPFNGKVDMGAYEFTGTVPTATKFTEGNLVALRVGDGSTTIGANSTNVNVIEYNTLGTASGLTIALPSTGTNSFVLGGTTTIPEGQLTLSGDGRYLSAAGYNTSTGSSTAANSDKIVARIDDKLNLDLSTKMPVSNALSGNFVRNAVTENGSSFFVTANTTARQVNLGANTSATFAGGAGYYSMLRLGGKSYYLNFQVPGYITDAGVATNLPSGAGTNALPNFTGASEGTVFTLLDSDPAVSYNSTGYDLLFIAEKSSGIRKWYFDATNSIWVPAGIVNPTGTPSIAGGFYSVVSKMVAGKPELYAIKGVGSNNAVFKIVDNAARTADWQTGTAPTVTTIIPAGNNYTFRGLTFAPVNKPENQLLAAVQGNSLLICSGSDAVFTLIGTSGATVTYNINGGTNATAVLTGGTATVTVSGATANQTLNLVSITNGTTTQAVSGSYLISITTPSVGGTISTPSAVCTGTNSTTLTLSGHTGTILGWESSLDNFATAGTYINYLSTVYTVTNLSATTSYRAIIQSGSCATVKSSVSTITVSSVTASAGSNSPICAGNTLNLTASGGTTYTWSGPNAYTSTSQNPTVSNPTSGTYQVMVTDGNGCTATASVALIVNPAPTATASSNSPICAGNTLNLTSSGGATYTWSGPNSYSSTSQNPTVSNPTSGTYQVTVTDANACTATASVAVIVNALPTVTGNLTIYVGATTTLSGSGTAVSSNPWISASTNVATINNSGVVTGVAVGTSIITYTNNNGCSQTTTVTVVENPTITITGMPLSIFNTNQGTPSSNQSYTVSGIYLNSNISIAAPTGFEISLTSNNGFGGGLTLTQSGGNVASTNIYVRLVGAVVGSFTGNLTHNSTGATTMNVAVNGTVAAGGPCQSTVNLVSTTDDYNSGTQVKQASATNGKITATNKITGNAKTTYQAKSIELLPGFKADSGTVFKAEIGGCN